MRRWHRPWLESLEDLTLPSFLPPVTYPVGDLPAAVVAGDLNGDGAPDLVSADASGVSVLLNQGDGTFRPAGSYASGGRAYAVALGDFTGSGVLDLAVANGDDTISVLLGNDDGTFQPPVHYAVDANPKALAVADLNNDGALDIVSANEGAADASVLLGNGDGTFQDAVSYYAGGTPRSVAVGDFTGSGIPDIVVASDQDYGVQVLLGNGDGSFQAPVYYYMDGKTEAVALGDFTGTGTLDLVTGTRSGSKVSPGNGDGTFGTPDKYRSGTVFGIAVGDFNGDGKLDFAAATGNHGARVYLSNGDGSFQPALTLATGPATRALTAADLTGDGLPDLVTTNQTRPGSVEVLVNAGDWGETAVKADQDVVPVPVRLAGLDTLADAHLGPAWDQARQAETRRLEQVTVFQLGPFPAAGDDQHGQVEQLDEAGRVAGRHDALYDEQLAAGSHRPVGILETAERLLVVPFVDDVLKSGRG